MAEPKKNKKKGTAPSKEDAAAAMEMIKVLQEKGDENLLQKREQEEQSEKQRLLEEAEKLRIQIAQEQVKRKLRENLKKKEEEGKKNGVTKFLESATVKNSKIKWKSISGGHKLQGYVDNKLIFEINRGMMLFSLYVKDKKLMEKKKLSTSYIGCSTSILKLKHKSDKLI
jgi:transposase